MADIPPDEIIRRRATSIKAMKVREREEFERRYQEECDRRYWMRGQCCAGCDHWHSSGGYTGQCDANGLVSGEDVMRSIGAISASFTPEPGFPFTMAEFYCGKFRDDFDWSMLDRKYLARIGAMKHGNLRPKPGRGTGAIGYAG